MWGCQSGNVVLGQLARQLGADGGQAGGGGFRNMAREKVATLAAI